MQKYFLVGEAAKTAHITSETLRHYDRIGLVKASKKDDFTGYRYYTQQDIVRINTVCALQQMDLPLQKIKEVLALDDLEKIVAFLAAAENRADEKMALLQYSKSKIQLAKADYQSKLCGQSNDDEIAVKQFPQRVIMISDTLETPTLDNLWDYLSHFYDKIEQTQKSEFTFEDLAGIYTENGISRMFAVCIRYKSMNGLKTLPKGKYLCAACTEENRADKLNELLQIAQTQYKAKPGFAVQQIVLSGILQWKYQVQVYIGN